MKKRSINLDMYTDLFIAIKKLNIYCNITDSIRALDMYFKTNDSNYLVSFDHIRDFIVESNIINTVYPTIKYNYIYLEDFIDDLALSQGKDIVDFINDLELPKEKQNTK